MARTNQPSAATQRTTATTPMDADGPGSFDAHDQRGENSQGENNQVGDNAERRENLTAVQDKPDNDRDDSRENRDDSREYRRESRGGREFGESREERTQHDGYTEQGSRREQPPISAGLDAFTPVLEAWKQVFKSWSELAETMVKAQQDAFASMISAANTTATNINVGDRPDSELAFSGSRTTTSTPDRIERDRR
jgi:hypothetical protein